MNEFKDSKSAKASKEADSQVDPRSSMGSDVDSLLDWTNTTSDVDVTSFRHTVIKRDGKKFKYKCDYGLRGRQNSKCCPQVGGE